MSAQIFNFDQKTENFPRTSILNCIIKSLSIEKGAKNKVSLLEALMGVELSLEVVKSIVSVAGGGEELTFLSQDALASFIEKAPSDWGVESDYSPEVTVTLAPLARYGHGLVEDRAIIAALSVRCKVLEGKRCTYQEAPSIENRVRMYRVEEIKQNMGGTLKFGSTVFSVRHRGQKITCNKCGAQGHISKDCEKGWPCNKCGEEGHVSRECLNGVKCSICKSEDHMYRTCLNAYGFKTKVGSRWGNVAATDDEYLAAGVAADRTYEDKKEETNGIVSPAKSPDRGRNPIETNSKSRGYGSPVLNDTAVTQLPMGGLTDADWDVSPDSEC